MVEHRARHAPVLGGGKVIRRGPAVGAELVAMVVLAGLERLERDAGVAVVVVTDLVEIVVAGADRQVLAPVVGIAPIDDAAPGVDLGDDVGAGAHRRLQRSLGEVAVLPVVLRQDRQEAADQQRQLPVRAVGEDELDRTLAQVRDLHHLLVGGARVGPAMGAYGLQAEDDVVHGHRRAVGEARLGPERERHPGAVLGHLDRLGEQAIQGEGLVPDPLQQGLGVEVGAGGGRALDDVAVQGIERTDDGQAQGAALGRVGIDVVQVAEVGRVFGLAVHGDAVLGLGGGADRKGHGQRRGDEGDDEASKGKGRHHGNPRLTVRRGDGQDQGAPRAIANAPPRPHSAPIMP